MIKELYQKGMTISDIARKLHLDRKTVRKYVHAGQPPKMKRRAVRKSKLDPFKPYLQQRMFQDGVFNGEKLFHEIKARGYTGGRTILKDYMQPSREQHRKSFTVRFETAPGEQMQVDWKSIGSVMLDGQKRKISMFVAVLGYSRMKYVEFTDSEDQEHVMQCLIHSFKYFGGIPQHVLFDNMRTVTDGRREGLPQWNQRFAEFAEYYSFMPKACKPYRAQTKGKVERAIRYIHDHFYQGTNYASLSDLNQKVLRWLDQVGNRKIHGTTGVSPQERWADETLRPIWDKPDYDTSYRSYRKVHWDGSFSYNGERIILPPRYAGEEILVKEDLNGPLSLYHRGKKIDVSIPIKKKQHVRQHAVSVVQVAHRPLSTYDDLIRRDQS